MSAAIRGVAQGLLMAVQSRGAAIDPPALALDLQLIEKDEKPLIHDLDLFLERADLGKLPAGPVSALSASGTLEQVAPAVGAAQVRAL